MITVKEFMELVDYRITEGSDYYTNVEGLYMLSSWNGDQDGWSVEIAFSPTTQVVYLAEAHDFKNGRAYRVKHPSLEVDDTAWDDVKFVDLETDEDFMDKARAIIADEDYDTRVSVPLTLSDDVLFELMKNAHDRDITFNQLMEEIIKDAIEAEGVNTKLYDDELEQGSWDDLAEDDHWDDEIVDDEPVKKKKKKKSK